MLMELMFLLHILAKEISHLTKLIETPLMLVGGLILVIFSQYSMGTEYACNISQYYVIISIYSNDQFTNNYAGS